MYVPFLQVFFKTNPLPLPALALTLAFSSIVFVAVEPRKLDCATQTTGDEVNDLASVRLLCGRDRALRRRRLHQIAMVPLRKLDAAIHSLGRIESGYGDAIL
jgi:hypothetical protein